MLGGFFFLRCPLLSAPFLGLEALPLSAGVVDALLRFPGGGGTCATQSPAGVQGVPEFGLLPHGASVMAFSRGRGVGVFIISSVGEKYRKP